MDFSLMFWGTTSSDTDAAEKYKLLLEAVRYADSRGFKAVWIPERHFNPWGGLFPNPSVVCAALATVTKQIRLRAGSVVAPLHHPIRIAEEWSIVDNLSGGRVELAMATGWKDDDFVLAPNNYATRRSIHVKAIETVQSLWRGEKVAAMNGSQKEIEVAIYPKPIQEELPIWVTSAGSLKSYSRAGSGGFGLLTHLLGQTFSELQEKIQQYQAYRVSGGFQTKGNVSLMMHTFIGQDQERVRGLVKEPLSEYLLQSAELGIPVELRSQWDSADASLKKLMIEQAFDRYFDSSALMGTSDICTNIIKKVEKMGVTDICCLIDFGLSSDDVISSLELLAVIKDQMAAR